MSRNDKIISSSAMSESETQFVRRTRREALLNDFKKLRRHQQEAIAAKIELHGVENADALFDRLYEQAKKTKSLAYFWSLVLEYGHRSRNCENPFHGK